MESLQHSGSSYTAADLMGYKLIIQPKKRSRRFIKPPTQDHRSAQSHLPVSGFFLSRKGRFAHYNQLNMFFLPLRYKQIKQEPKNTMESEDNDVLGRC